MIIHIIEYFYSHYLLWIDTSIENYKYVLFDCTHGLSETLFLVIKVFKLFKLYLIYRWQQNLSKKFVRNRKN